MSNGKTGSSMRLMCTMSLVIVFVLTMVPASRAENESVKLDDVVVSATKTDKHLDDTPASVSVISHRDMELKNLTTVDEALKDMAGVYVKRTKGLRIPRLR